MSASLINILVLMQITQYSAFCLWLQILTITCNTLPDMTKPKVGPGYLRGAGVGGIQKAPEQGLSVKRADGGGGVGEEVVVKHALSEKLVKQPGRVGRAQGASEPGMLDGNIHSGWRQVYPGLASRLRVQQVKEGRQGKVERIGGR